MQQSPELTAILTTPVQNLGLSESFCTNCERMGFRTLENIVFILPEDLIIKEHFSYTWLEELSIYLDKRGLLYLLQPLPGKNSG
jgi:hypothetical protein